MKTELPLSHMATAARCVIQLLFATGKTYTVDGLREKLRALFKEDPNPEFRAVAAIKKTQLVSALIQANEVLDRAGICVRIDSGVVSLSTTSIGSRRLCEHIESLRPKAPSPSGLTQGMLDVLACIALKQPILQAEIDWIFDAEKRETVARLRSAGMVETTAGNDGRLRLVTSRGFLEHFHLESLEDFRRRFQNTDMMEA